MYIGLKNYLDILTKDYNLRIAIKDFKGIFNDIKMYDTLKTYSVHKAAYCMAIKDNEKLWKYCRYNNKLIEKKLSSSPEPFFGTCYAGVNEFIYPIMCKEEIIGAITIGGKPIEEMLVEERLWRIKKNNVIDIEGLIDLYHKSNVELIVTVKELNNLLGIISDHISLMYANYQKDEIDNEHVVGFGESYIISHAVEYIHQHFQEDLRVSKLTAFCHCSRSYLSHNFKKYLGVSVKHYINQVRVDEAKKRLTSRKVSISHLAYELGFKDSNYFSKVFKDIEGISPRNYIKRLNI